MCPSRTGEDKGAARSGIGCSAVTDFGQPRSFLGQERIARAGSKEAGDRPERVAAVGGMVQISSCRWPTTAASQESLSVGDERNEVWVKMFRKNTSDGAARDYANRKP